MVTTRLFTIVLAAFILAGCCTTKEIIKYEYIEVKVPVPVEIEPPPVIDLPVLKISEITDTTPDDRIVAYYQATVEQLKGVVKQLNTILDGYRKPPVAK